MFAGSMRTIRYGVLLVSNSRQEGGHDTDEQLFSLLTMSLWLRWLMGTDGAQQMEDMYGVPVQS